MIFYHDEKQKLIAEEMKKELFDSFIMFWPNDDVSGDFYWFYQRGDESIIVCAE